MHILIVFLKICAKRAKTKVIWWDKWKCKQWKISETKVSKKTQTKWHLLQAGPWTFVSNFQIVMDHMRSMGEVNETEGRHGAAAYEINVLFEFVVPGLFFEHHWDLFFHYPHPLHPSIYLSSMYIPGLNPTTKNSKIKFFSG